MRPFGHALTLIVPLALALAGRSALVPPRSFATVRQRVFARAHLPTRGGLPMEEVPDERAGQRVEPATAVDQDLRDDRLVDSGERVNDVDQGRRRGSQGLHLTRVRLGPGQS